MIPEKLEQLLCQVGSYKELRSKFDENTRIFKEGEEIVLKIGGRVFARFLDDESQYSLIAEFITKKLGIVSTYRVVDTAKVLKSIYINMILLTETEDKNGFSHTQRVAMLAERFAKFLGWDDEKAEELKEHAYLHDVGKVAIEQLMLYSPTRIRTFEQHYEDHPQMGTIYLASHEELWKYIQTVRHHHERWDGKGFPDGLKGEEIPLYARIVGIIDYYDEVTNFVSADWDSEIKTPKQALEEIQRLAGKWFDPNLVAKFVEFMEKEVGV